MVSKGTGTDAAAGPAAGVIGNREFNKIGRDLVRRHYCIEPDKPPALSSYALPCPEPAFDVLPWDGGISDVQFHYMPER